MRTRASALLLSGVALLLLAVTGSGQPDDGNEPRIAPPVGVSVDAGLTSLDIAWTRGPGSTVPVEAFVVRWWPADVGFRASRRVPGQPTPDTHLTITGLQPDTTYAFAVRAATATLLPGLERAGDWTLSAFSRVVQVRTQPARRIRLEGGSLATALFAVTCVESDGSDGETGRFLVSPGLRVGERLGTPGGVVDFSTAWTLRDLRLVRRPAPGAPAVGRLMGPDGRSVADSSGDPLHFTFPAAGPRRVLLEATLESRTAGGETRTRQLLQSE